MGIFAKLRYQLLFLAALSGGISLVSVSGFSQEETDLERRGLFQRIFHKDQQSKHPLPGPGYNEPVHGVYMDRETDTISRLIKELPEAVESRDNDPVERYPHIPGYLSIKNASQEDIDDLIERIYDGYEARIDRMDPPDLRSARVLAMGTVPTGSDGLEKQGSIGCLGRSADRSLGNRGYLPPDPGAFQSGEGSPGSSFDP